MKEALKEPREIDGGYKAGKDKGHIAMASWKEPACLPGCKETATEGSEG